jgi:hypothetical protein
MRKTLALLAAGFMVMAGRTFAQPAAAPADKEYSITQRAKVGGTGGFDYVYADSEGRKLYVPRSGNGAHTDVFDLDSLAKVATIANTPGDHGVAVDPKSHRGFVSSGPITMFNSETFETIKTIDPQGGRPDGIFFEPFTERVYVLSHSAPNVVVLDGKDGSVVGTIDLGGQPEQGQSDGAGKVYIDLEDKSQIAVVDAKAMKVLDHYDISSKGTAPAGLGLDTKNNILFSMCATPPTCVILTTDGKILDALPIGAGTDSGGFNPNTLEAFSSNGSAQGELTIIKETSPTTFVVEQKLKTMPGAKTCTLDTKTNRIIMIATEMLPPTTAPTAAATPASQPAPGAAGGGVPAGGARAGAGGARGGAGGRGGRGGGRGTPAPDGFTILAASR